MTSLTLLQRQPPDVGLGRVEVGLDRRGASGGV